MKPVVQHAQHMTTTQYMCWQWPSALAKVNLTSLTVNHHTSQSFRVTAQAI